MCWTYFDYFFNSCSFCSPEKPWQIVSQPKLSKSYQIKETALLPSEVPVSQGEHYGGHPLSSTLVQVLHSFSDRVIIFCIWCQLVQLSFNFYILIYSIAPMMDLTDNHYRTLARIISKNAWLYSEMIAAETIVFQKGNLVIASCTVFLFCSLSKKELLWSKYCVILQERHLMIL